MMLPRTASRLLIGALVLMAFVGPGYAAETTLRANATVNGEGRFYQGTETTLVFVGYFQGTSNVTQPQGDLVINAASMVCPGVLEVNRVDNTEQGEGRCIFLRQDGDRLYARWTCTGKTLQGCRGPFTVVGGTGVVFASKVPGQVRLAALTVKSPC